MYVSAFIRCYVHTGVCVSVFVHGGRWRLPVIIRCALLFLLSIFVFFFFFFFFQAEDGIRDDLVTGVQTCALPICFIVHRRRFARGNLCWLWPGRRANLSRAEGDDSAIGCGRPSRRSSRQIGRASCRERV